MGAGKREEGDAQGGELGGRAMVHKFVVGERCPVRMALSLRWIVTVSA